MIHFYIISFRGWMKMQKNNVFDYSFSILLGISLLIAGSVWVFGTLHTQEAQVVSRTFTEKTGKISQGLHNEIQELADMLFPGQPVDVAVDEEETEVVDIPENLAILEENTETENVAVEVTQKEMTSLEETIEEDAPKVYKADIRYFDDALFIGDSRTVGLYEYGGLGNAEVFADTGMSIYKVFNEEFALKSGEMVTLNEALLAKDFGKIYIMLGINELGYDFEQTVERFSEAIDTILTYQPHAYIFIQANLHITKEKSEESEYFTNSNIDRYNEAISKLADNERIFYLDVNPLYDDEEGYLSKEFTADHAHIKGKHYIEWVDFILQNAVERE